MKTKRKINLKREVLRYLGIVVGAAIFGMAYSWFLIPYKIAPGGVGGIAQIVNFYTRIPIGVSMIVMNLPLL